MSEYVEVEVLMLKGDKGDAGATEWGGIAGAISDNNELQAALDKKADVESLKTLAISGKFSDVLEKPTTLRGYGVEPQTAYGEIKDLVKPNFSSLQGSPAENYNLKIELNSKATVAQFSNLKREVSILQSAVNSRATTTQVNELSSEVANKAGKYDVEGIKASLDMNKADKEDVYDIKNQLFHINIKIENIQRAIDGLHAENNAFPKKSFLTNHPVGSLYISFSGNNPHTFYGGDCGSWQLIEGKRMLDIAVYIWKRTG